MKENFTRGQLLDGRFRTLAPLNHGSFGMVFLAEDTLTNKRVAIKCLTRPGAAATPDTVIADEGAEELNCHTILQSHPNLVNLTHCFESKAHTYLVLEYCSQGDLYEAIRLGQGPLETEHVRQFMLQLIGAVDHMHKNGLYHRDIKPENIFLTKDGSMKLGDFGLATRNAWSHESCVGSDRYMAPEQYDPAGLGYAPAKADIWSIGVCLLNVLFSRNPFVTPTDSDVLFADYRRDRQSLFDIFPAMSQDTVEILSIAMALDPNKRDLAAVRRAVLRAISFTTDEESFDTFCAEGRDVVRASANREPLRTPSIQSPLINGDDSFPWAKALHASPQERQLSAIPDNESYEEDLFPASEKGLNLGESWFSRRNNTPSLSSVLDSAFGASFKSMAIRRPIKSNPPRPDPVHIANSLPVQVTRPIPTMSMIFGRKKDTVAKSWSEMFEEDEEEAELEKRREQNSRTWSQESQHKVAVRPGILTETKSHSSINARRNRADTNKSTSSVKPSGSPNENEPFSFRARARYSPTKAVVADKWAALGIKRRNFHVEPAKPAQVVKKRSMTTESRKKSVHESGVWHRRDSRDKARPAYLNQDWRQPKTSFDSSADEDDLEWVGGWHSFE
jgi:serine/threonine protein kinase